MLLAAGLVVFVALATLLVPWHPVDGGAPAPVPADSVFTAAELTAAENYSGWVRLWSRTGLVLSLAVACLLGLTPLGRRLMDRLPGPWWVRVVQGVAALTVLGSLVTLPTAVLVRRRQLEVGLSHQEWTGFALDRLLGVGVTTVATSLALVVLIACARRWRRAWPAVAGLLLAALVMLGSFVYPLLVEPLFNDFRSLPDGSLRQQVLALAEQEDVPVDDVLVADASRRTTTLNAYVSGFGDTRRVVLYDNLVDDAATGETLAVVAHELAHARYDDVLAGSLLGASGVVAGIGLLGLLLERRRGSGVADPRSVPLLLALFALASLLAMPVQNTISRKIETRADVTALETTQDADSFVALQRQLALRSLQDPTPASWSQFWFGSHPTVLERIALAERVAGDR